MKGRQSGLTQECSSAKAGISERSGRRIERAENNNRKARHWRTRQDPLEAVWLSQLRPLLQKEPGLTGLTLWEMLDERYPGEYPHGLLRTLQRRVKHFRATEGPEKAVIFRQSYPAGLQGLSDFTHPRDAITIAGEDFKHLLYQYRLAFSGWRHVHIVQGGESYSALAEGLQNALSHSGGAPSEHRTDSLSAAYVNAFEKQKLTEDYEKLCEHYGMRATRNNLGISHENGAIETAHGSLKHRLEQALKLRGSKDFQRIADYRQFIEGIVSKLNRRCLTRFTEEKKVLQALPPHRYVDYLELSVKVTTSSTINVKRVLYTVPSRLIGETLRIHLYHDKLACHVSQTLVLILKRVYPEKNKDRARSIDYRHLVQALASKPQAFRFSQFRDDIFPNAKYKQLWEYANQQFSPQESCKWMVCVLKIAAEQHCEEALAETLLRQWAQGALPDFKTLQSRYLRHTEPPTIPVRQHNLSHYTALLQGQWAEQEASYV